MKQRCKRDGLYLAQEFVKFESFLEIMKPRTARKYTIDRKDSSKGYTPENCRWADKKVQGLNKANVIHLTYKSETRPLVVWAKRTKQLADTLYKRKNLGWTDEEIITGHRMQTSLPPRPWPKETYANWEALYKERARQGESAYRFYERFCVQQLWIARHPSPYDLTEAQIEAEREWDERWSTLWSDARRKLFLLAKQFKCEPEPEPEPKAFKFKY
jgi:hypothetical protein